MTTAGLDSVLAEAGLRMDSGRFLQLVADAASKIAPPQSSPADYFSTAQRRVLTEVGLDLSEQGEHGPDARARSVAARAVLADAALTVAQAAERLGIDSSRVRHRIANGQLTGWKDRGWRLPSWQFSGDTTLPGLATVLAAVPSDQPPLMVAGFMATPQPDLELDGAPVTPRQWLLAHGDPRPVADLVATLGTAA